MGNIIGDCADSGPIAKPDFQWRKFLIQNPLDSIRVISVEGLRSHWPKPLHESVVLSILENPQWNCYQTLPNVSSQF